MQDREDHNSLGFDPEEDGIREFRKNGTSDFPVYTREHLWVALNGVECGINGCEKPFPKAFALLFVIPESTCEVPSNLPTVYNW